MKTSLEDWQSVWRELGASSANEELYHQLVASYSEPHRKYHTLQHLNECLTHLESVRALADHADEGNSNNRFIPHCFRLKTRKPLLNTENIG